MIIQIVIVAILLANIIKLPDLHLQLIFLNKYTRLVISIGYIKLWFIANLRDFAIARQRFELGDHKVSLSGVESDPQ